MTKFGVVKFKVDGKEHYNVHGTRDLLNQGLDKVATSTNIVILSIEQQSARRLHD